MCQSIVVAASSSKLVLEVGNQKPSEKTFFLANTKESFTASPIPDPALHNFRPGSHLTNALFCSINKPEHHRRRRLHQDRKWVTASIGPRCFFSFWLGSRGWHTRCLRGIVRGVDLLPCLSLFFYSSFYQTYLIMYTLHLSIISSSSV